MVINYGSWLKSTFPLWCCTKTSVQGRRRREEEEGGEGGAVSQHRNTQQWRADKLHRTLSQCKYIFNVCCSPPPYISIPVSTLRFSVPAIKPLLTVLLLPLHLSISGPGRINSNATLNFLLFIPVFFFSGPSTFPPIWRFFNQTDRSLYSSSEHWFPRM